MSEQVRIPSWTEAGRLLYWMDDVSDTLTEAVETYLRGEPLTHGQIALLRSYLMHWIEAPVWAGNGVEQLRERVSGISRREDIDDWLSDAVAIGIDPI